MLSRNCTRRAFLPNLSNPVNVRYFITTRAPLNNHASVDGVNQSFSKPLLLSRAGVERPRSAFNCWKNGLLLQPQRYIRRHQASKARPLETIVGP